MSRRDKRALALLGGAAVVFLVFQFGVAPGGEQGSVFAPSLELAEKRVRRLQQVAQRKPRAAAEAEAAARALADAEKGLLKAATPALASAEMQQLVKDLLAAQGINMGNSEFGTVRPAGEGYLQVPLAVGFTCAVEQWINLMSALRNAPQALSTVELRISQGDLRAKTATFRMIVAGYIREPGSGGRL